MNLTTERWIPIVWDNGKPGHVSLSQVFQRGERIHDLAVRPHERIALMRLFICIAQAALDGPVDYADWKGCRPRTVYAASDYLKRWQHAFELFGNEHRFLQINNLERQTARAARDEDQGKLASKLDLALATGNNTTLFDNSGGEERTIDPAQLALNLLAFHCFSPGGRIGVALWNGQETIGKGSSDHAPCLAGSMLHAILRGENLLQTIHLNILRKSQVTDLYGKDRWGKPVWELWPLSHTDAEGAHAATSTYLGRLVPLSRAVRIDNNCRTIILANGLKYPPYPEWREPTATLVSRIVKGHESRLVLRASLEKAPWRELHSLTVKVVTLDSNGGPLALGNVPIDTSFDLWVGGLVADQAKLLDTVESIFHVPATMLTEPGQRAYERGVAYAEETEFRLRNAISHYHKELGDNLGRSEMRERREQIQQKATFQYWTGIEIHLGELLAAAEDPSLLDRNAAWHKTDWGRAVLSEAVRAYEFACPHDTARQFRAYALGRRTLVAPHARKPSELESAT